MLMTAIPDSGLWLQRTLYVVQSAITATAELLVFNCRRENCGYTTHCFGHFLFSDFH